MSTKFPSKRAQEVASYFLEYDSQSRYDNNSRIRDHIRFFFIRYYYRSFVIGECCCRIVFIVAIFTVLYVFNQVKRVSSIGSFLHFCHPELFLCSFPMSAFSVFLFYSINRPLRLIFFLFLELQSVYNYVLIALERIIYTALLGMEQINN